MLSGWAFVLDSLDSSLILPISPLFISALKISFTFLTLVAQFTDKELNVHPRLYNKQGTYYTVTQLDRRQRPGSSCFKGG